MIGTQIKPCGIAVEGIFYPERPGFSHQEWVAEAEAHAASLWQAIGSRSVLLSRKGINWAQHALRSDPRGYGKKRKHWDVTTECGQIMLQDQGWDVVKGPLSDTTCLTCRTVVRERYENDLTFGDPRADEIADEYDQQQYAWQTQAQWHQPGPAGDNAYWAWHDRVLFPAGALMHPGFKRDDRVQHQYYGAGVVIAVAAIESEMTALVMFDARPERPKTVSATCLTVASDSPDQTAVYSNWVGEGVFA